MNSRSQKEKEKRIPKKKKITREKMKEDDIVKSDIHQWKIVKLLGSGGFGDVYKVTKVGGDKEYAMKTEMVIGDKRMLRLKIEVAVLMLCHEQLNPLRKKHFVDFVDRGKTEKFKFLVMGLVGPSLEDIRKMFLVRNYNKSTAMQASMQTLQALWDLHETGYMHRDIKPQNFAIGLGEFEKTIYMLDFGIARKFTVGNTKQMKVPRSRVKFLGTLRFASRACHKGIEQGRKDDLETWLYMAFDLFDDENGLPWKRAERSKIVDLKEMFFKLQFPKCYRIVPNEFKRIVEYVNELHYAEEPDYVYVADSLKLISRENKIDLEKKLDWIGKTHKTDREEDDPTSTDNKNTGSDDSESSEFKNRERMGKKNLASQNSQRKGSQVLQRKAASQISMNKRTESNKKMNELKKKQSERT